MLLKILTSQLNVTLPWILILRYCWIRFSLCLIPCNKSIDPITLFWKGGLVLHWNIFLSRSVNMKDNNNKNMSLLPPCDVHNLFLYQVHWILYLMGIFKYLLQTQHLLNMYIRLCWMKAKLESKVLIDLVGFGTY